MDAVEAKRAIHVANLARLKQRQLTAANHHQLRGRLGLSANAVLGVAGDADVRFANLHFERRKRRGHKVKLSDRTNEFAERGMLEKPVDHEHGQEVGDDQPGRPPGRRP